MATSIGVKLGIDGENEYRKALKNIVEQTKTLDKQMKTLESSFGDETDEMEKNAKQTELLRKKAEKLTEEIEMMKNMVEKAAEIYGESSTECQKWEQALADAQTELNNTNAAIEEHEEAADGADTALGRLTDEISAQNAELDNLREAYINAVLEFGEGSEEAETLADEIVNLNNALEENEATLESATASADALTDSMGSASDSTSEIGDAAMGALDKFAPAMAGIVQAATAGGVAGAILAIGEAVESIITGAIQLKDEFDNAFNEIVTGTGQVGPELDSMKLKAMEMWAAIKDEDFSLADAAGTVAALNTRLGESVSSSDAANFAVNQFAVTAGMDTQTAVNGLVDIMKLWGMTNGDTATTVNNLISVCDLLMNAQAQADIPVTTMMTSLKEQAGAMDMLDISLEEGVALLSAYRDAGGNTTDITTGLYQAQKNLNEVTDDVPGAWKQVISTLENSDSVADALNSEIGNLGITISDVFGDRKAGKIAEVFTSSEVKVGKFSTALENSAGTLQTMYQETRTAKDETSQFNKELEIFVATSVHDQNILAEAGYHYGANQAAWMELFTTKTEETTEAASNSFRGMQGNFEMSLDEINEIVETSQRFWSNTIGQKIYGPQITAPTITYSKGANGSMIPSVTYHTYAKAYDQALELNNPTIFGAMGNSLLMGGEKAGAEIVVGENHLLDMFEKSVQNAIGYVGNGGIGQIENLLRQYLPKIGNQSIYIDGDALVGSTATKMNEALGRIDVMAGRGGY